MHGWWGKILRVDLTQGSSNAQEYSEEFIHKFIGGRGFASKVLWDELLAGTDPLSPESLFVAAAGHLTGLPLPSSGKLVVAAKSPLTGGYGDGNLGSQAAVSLRRAGYDALVVKGRSPDPSYLLVQDDKVEIRDAADLWGLDSFSAEKRLRERHGEEAGILLIGPGGEKCVSFANIVSQQGRAGGRPGMGAVLGSKNLKALVFVGTREIPVADAGELDRLGAEAKKSLVRAEGYRFWKRQGTTATVEWCQGVGTLPTRNFREAVFEGAETIGGDAVEKAKTKVRGCPLCNMTCGHVVPDCGGSEAEVDYENVAMLGSNLGIRDLGQVAWLNRRADELGLDTISLGSVLGFAMECTERGVGGIRLPWGDFAGASALVEDIAYRRGVGEILAQGVRRAAEVFGHGSEAFAMHVKGLEISAYDCRLCPGMALSFGTSPIGAHHKDAWIIAWEIGSGKREEYSEAKVEKVIELQRIRGGMFECLVTCRFPWIELGLDLAWYPKFLRAATGVDFTLEHLYEVGDRIYSLIRSFWVREQGGRWDRTLDFPPARWFDEPTTLGPFVGSRLDRVRYDSMLGMYYEKRGWDQRGIPTAATMKRLGLAG